MAGKLNISLSKDDCHDLLSTLANLPALADIKPSLTKLRDTGFKVVAFSNSSLALLSSQLENAGLNKYFDNVISVESAGTFKPSADAYQFALQKLNVPTSYVCLVAAHDWDTHGALIAGLKAAFINRFATPYNPVYKRPEINAKTMNDITEQIIKENNNLKPLLRKAFAPVFQSLAV